MARRQKTRTRPATPAPASSAIQMPGPATPAKPAAGNRSDSAAVVPVASSAPTVSRRFVLLTAAAGAVWIGVLIVLAVFTANPVTLNREQIRSADAIVTARVFDASAGVVRVEHTWTARRELGANRLMLPNLAESGARNGESYIVPLSRIRGDRYEVTRTRLPNQQPLVYPATEEGLSQLRAMLERNGNGG